LRGLRQKLAILEGFVSLGTSPFWVCPGIIGKMAPLFRKKLDCPGADGHLPIV
jgi:hypothetical protein